VDRVQRAACADIRPGAARQRHAGASNVPARALGLVKASDWGWGSGEVISSLAVAAIGPGSTICSCVPLAVTSGQ